ncbi:S8 family peptidase [[Clostridium] fimetarium]|uniref:Subtilase family protein n=1 Tax=[Clostridium] fimetarium TaxID=99656 RepID=A0A1I0RWS3_9FIRM|nr:S8 family peptidase [[Clostridium] fimetarium]SEW45960.1 Subtilase family protein [[Clostridium] fimetarium]
MDNNCKEAILSEDYADFIINSGNALDEITKIDGTCSFNLRENRFNVYVPISNLPKNFFQMFGYSAIPNVYGLLDIGSLEASGVLRVQNIPILQLRGSGVLIGIIDTGIDYRQEAFINSDKTSKVYSIWDQTIDSENSQPEGFYFGTEYTQSQINTALASQDPLSVVPSNDDNGHGTFLAGIAAGNRNEKEKFSGVVPDAEIVMVKLKPAKKFLRDFWRIPDGVLTYQKNDFILAIRYLEEVAKNADRPMSIIMGIGTSQGGHDEKGSLSSYISELAAQEGFSISIAAGNEGSSGHHYLGFIQNENFVDNVELKVGENVSGFSMEFWGQTPSSFSISIKTPKGEFIPPIPQTIKETKEIRFTFESTTISVDYQLVEAQSGEQLILVRFTNPTPGVWTFQVNLKSNISLRYHIWLPIVDFLSIDSFFVQSNPEYTLTSPANTFIPLVATAYDYKTKVLYINASRGFMRNENISPTLAAPGVDLIGPSVPQGYKVSSGTSLAAAHTGGVAAMLLEWGIVRKNYPQMSTVQIRNLLIRGASRENSIIYPSRQWGYGILDLYNAYNTFRNTIT